MVGDTLWRLTRGSVCCGLVVRERCVVEAAPILRWTEGGFWPDARARLKASGWHGEPILSR